MNGQILILLSALMFGSYGVWSKLIGTEFGVFYQGWTKALFLLVVLIPILLYTKKITPIPQKDWGWLSVFLIFTSATQAPLFYAFNHMDIGTATLLFFVSMVLTMYIIGFIFLGEKLNTLKAISLIAACIGMYLTFSFSLEFFTILAALMAVLNGIASGGEIAFSKKLSGDYSPLYLCWLSWIIIFITNAAISIALGETQHSLSFDVVWLYQLGFAVCSLLGFWLVIAGLKKVEASIGGLLGLIEIVFGIVLGIIIFNEQLSSRIILGAIFIIFAAALPHLVDIHKKRTIKV